ncbi:MAG TPA: substrate-binding domain-containing protein [Vicinamibacterales bacterium]
MTPLLLVAQITVMASGGFRAALQTLVPDFERATGITVTIVAGPSQGSGPDTIGAQLRRGVAADMVIMSREGLEELIADKRIVAGSEVDLAKTPLGVAVRAGAPKPDISSVDAVKQMLLRAKSVTFRSSTTGIYLTKTLFPRLGIADEMARKSTTVGVSAVANGDTEIALQPISELLPQPGAEVVGPLPAQIQYVSVFSAAVLTQSRDAAACRRLIAYLASEKADAAIAKAGMQRTASLRPAMPRVPLTSFLTGGPSNGAWSGAIFVLPSARS